MKKVLGLLIVSLTLIASAFSFSFSLGGNFSFGGNVGNEYPEADGMVLGGGFVVNTELIGGFGVQAEVNLVGRTIKTGENSITFSKNSCKVIDVPIMAFYNYPINDRLKVGGGAGINLGFYSDPAYKNSKSNSNMNIGLAIGGNLKYYVFQNFGLVLGLLGVFDFLPTTKETTSNETTYIFGDGATRKGIYGTVGVEFRLF